MLLVLGDLLVINGTYLASLLLAKAMSGTSTATFLELVLSFAGWFVFVSLLWGFVARVNECYEIAAIAKPAVATRRIFVVLVYMGIVYIILFYFIQFSLPPKIVLPIFLPLSLGFLLAWRSLYLLVFRMPTFKRRILIVGAGWAGSVIARELQHLNWEYGLLGFIDDDPTKQAQQIEGAPVLGTRADLLGIINDHGAQELVLSITHEIHDQLFEALIEAQENGIEVTPMATLYENLTGRVPVEHINHHWYTGLPIVPKHGPLYAFSKRATDLIVGMLGLIVTGVVLPFMALAIRLDSSGPIFYHQERVGHHGRVFKLVKFRSMFTNAEADGKAVWAVDKDVRVTRVGRLLRLTRMDELPQFLNVLRGDLSLVGPRPERPAFVEELQKHIPFYRSRLMVKPGLTGWAQVKYRYGNTIEDALVKLQYDLYYIGHQSILLDLVITLKTLWVVVFCKGT